ncbi:hypothetical protein [Subtercola lobariae]|nr:hypothetical protein [Subtercola lobariae]
MASKKFVSARRLSETVVESTMKTMKIEGRTPITSPRVRAVGSGDLVKRLKAHSHRTVPLAEFRSPYNDTLSSLMTRKHSSTAFASTPKPTCMRAEAQALADAREELYAGISSGELSTDDLTTPYALTDIHAACYGSI